MRHLKISEIESILYACISTFSYRIRIKTNRVRGYNVAHVYVSMLIIYSMEIEIIVLKDCHIIHGRHVPCQNTQLYEK